MATFLIAGPGLQAQVTLGTAVDLALANNPKIRMAQAEAEKVVASLAEAKDVYVPAVTAGAGLGNSYGYSPNPPTLFAFNAQSLIYNASQRSYIRSAHFGITAAEARLADARQGVAEDTALTFIALQHDQQRQAVLTDENRLAERLVSIVGDRMDAGTDNGIDLTEAKLTAARFRVSRLSTDDDLARDQDHLARLIGMEPLASLHADGEVPLTAPEADLAAPVRLPMTAAVASAYANADSKQQIAVGDARFLYRPQLTFIGQYNRYATFTDSFKQLQGLNSGIRIGANEGVFAVQIIIPFYDKVHAAKARESLADAHRARAEADDAQQTVLDGQFKLRHSVALLRARAEVANLDQQLAQQQLDALVVQLNTAGAAAGTGPVPSPKDEENSRLAEREKYLAVVDANFQLKQTQINLLRQTGQLETWLQQLAAHPVTLPAPRP